MNLNLLCHLNFKSEPEIYNYIEISIKYIEQTLIKHVNIINSQVRVAILS